MDNFLDRYQVPKLIQDQINHLKCSIIPKEVEAITKTLPTTTITAEDQMCLVQNPIRSLKKTKYQFKLFHTRETGGTLSGSFHEATIKLIPKPHKDATNREIQSNFPYEY